MRWKFQEKCDTLKRFPSGVPIFERKNTLIWFLSIERASANSFVKRYIRKKRPIRAFFALLSKEKPHRNCIYFGGITWPNPREMIQSRKSMRAVAKLPEVCLAQILTYDAQGFGWQGTSTYLGLISPGFIWGNTEQGKFARGAIGVLMKNVWDLEEYI